ncbi:hypothetical protein QP589_06225 [Helcobacillus massiliensis]|uniref:hypothetical protein n=1 Tax=Helcobacillus massiliensis TaxID=521392 RepID=UPI002552F868|nr:hypothetical protein [Helcobacillus massiliensis]MDK7742160.1 hypothetical protein [Helcobacillus massiliensis]
MAPENSVTGRRGRRARAAEGGSARRRGGTITLSLFAFRPVMEIPPADSPKPERDGLLPASALRVEEAAPDVQEDAADGIDPHRVTETVDGREITIEFKPVVFDPSDVPVAENGPADLELGVEDPALNYEDAEEPTDAEKLSGEEETADEVDLAGAGEPADAEDSADADETADVEEADEAAEDALASDPLVVGVELPDEAGEDADASVADGTVADGMDADDESDGDEDDVVPADADAEVDDADTDVDGGAAAHVDADDQRSIGTVAAALGSTALAAGTATAELSRDRAADADRDHDGVEFGELPPEDAPDPRPAPRFEGTVLNKPTRSTAGVGAWITWGVIALVLLAIVLLVLFGLIGPGILQSGADPVGPTTSLTATIADLSPPRIGVSSL